MRVRITIHPQLYKLIYDVLKEKFIEKEWPVSDGLPGEGFAVWEKIGEKGLHVVTIIFGVNYRYFYDRKGWAEDGNPIVMYNDLLEKVLGYVGCRGNNISELRTDFYKRFRVSKAIIEAQGNQKPVRKSSKKNAEKHEENYTINTSDQYITADTIQHKTVHNNFNIYGTIPDIPNDVSQVVYDFYEQIARASRNGFETAWLLLSKSFQDRIWSRMAEELKKDDPSSDKTGLDLFVGGYYFFRGLKETHVFNVKIYSSRAECMVYYEDEMELPYVDVLADIGKTAIKDVHSLVDKITYLSGIVEDFGGKGFVDKALIRLFYPTPTEIIWFEHGMDPVAFKKAFPSVSTDVIPRLLKCRCVKEDDRWFIDGLIPFHCRKLY